MTEGTPHLSSPNPHSRDRHSPGAGTPRPPLRWPTNDTDTADALAELFLGDAEIDADGIPLPPRKSAAPPHAPAPLTHPSAPVSAPDRASRHIEMLLLGHLPVIASPWIHQYARSRQRALNHPVALLRVRNGSASIDLIGASLDSPCRSIDGAIETLVPLAPHWLVSVDEVSEGEASIAPGVGSLTFLTGANEAAIVACYRALKGLSNALASLDAPPTLRTIIVGGKPDVANAAAARISRTAATFLSREVEASVIADKISPGRVVPVFVGACLSPVDTLLVMLADELGLADSVRTPPPIPVVHSAPSARPTTPGSPPFATPLFPGLRTIDARCPCAPLVEFAVAPDGVIHAISNAPDAPAVDRSIADLAAASAWVHVNEGLLRASIPELARRTLVIQTREHLVTTHPKQARRLLDTHVKVHVPHGASGFLDLN